MSSGKTYFERTMLPPEQENKFTFSGWFKNKPSKPTDWIHFPVTMSEPKNITFHISYNTQIDGVEFTVTDVTDGSGKLIERHCYRADALLGVER